MWAAILAPANPVCVGCSCLISEWSAGWRPATAPGKLDAGLWRRGGKLQAELIKVRAYQDQEQGALPDASDMDGWARQLNHCTDTHANLGRDLQAHDPQDVNTYTRLADKALRYLSQATARLVGFESAKALGWCRPSVRLCLNRTAAGGRACAGSAGTASSPSTPGGPRSAMAMPGWSAR